MNRRCVGVCPSFAKEGWTRPKENAAKHPLIGADGVVVSSVRLIGGLKQLPRLRQLRNGAIFCMAQPPLLRKEGTGSAAAQHLPHPQKSFYIVEAVSKHKEVQSGPRIRRDHYWNGTGRAVFSRAT